MVFPVWACAEQDILIEVFDILIEVFDIMMY